MHAAVGVNHITNASNRVNQLRTELAVDLVPQVLHEHIHRIRRWVVMHVPNLLDNLCTKHHLSASTHKQFEQ